MQRAKQTQVRIIELSKERVCAKCGDVFTPPKANQVYCSYSCRYEAKKEQTRKRHAMIPEDIIKAKNAQSRWGGNWYKALERDGFKCVICSSISGLNVHHIDANGEKRKGKYTKNNTSLDNLMTLCTQCHKDIHGILLTKKDGAWRVKGDIFEKLGLSGTIQIVED